MDVLGAPGDFFAALGAGSERPICEPTFVVACKSSSMTVTVRLFAPLRDKITSLHRTPMLAGAAEDPPMLTEDSTETKRL